MDALSAGLSTVRITGAITFNAEFTAPWGFAAPSAQELAPVLAPGTGYLVIYHLLTDGTALARVEGMEALPLGAGDIVVMPHGDPRTVSNGSPRTLMANAISISKYLSGDLSMTYYGGAGEATRFVCGFFGCDRHACRSFLAGLPSLLKINIRGDAGGAWLEHSIRHLVSEAVSRRPGRTILLSKMAEALFIEALRRYMDQLPSGRTGWLAGARDPVVGNALVLLHRYPCRLWTLATLAAEIGASRSVLAERFVHYLSKPPMSI